MLRRYLLPCVTLGLLAVVIGDRLADARRRAQPIETANETISATHSLDADAPGPEISIGRTGPARRPAVDRVARMATRQQLSREAGATYLDSLMLSTDSVVRRWPDRSGTPIRVAIIEGGAPGYTPRMKEFVNESLERWETLGIGVHFDVVRDTSDADVVVHWIDRFDFDRAGQTDLTWDQAGHVRRAVISLALRTSTGIRISRQGAPRRRRPRGRPRTRSSPLLRLERRDVSRHAHEHPQRARPAHGVGALPSAARTGARRARRRQVHRRQFRRTPCDPGGPGPDRDAVRRSRSLRQSFAQVDDAIRAGIERGSIPARW